MQTTTTLSITVIITSLIFITVSLLKSTKISKVVSAVIGGIMIAVTITLMLAYRNYTPANSAECQPKPIRYGVVKYKADITNFILDDVQAPALTFDDAEAAYRGPLSGYRTGYFAWDGKVARILKANAGDIANDKKTVGDWWVFGDYNNILISDN